jgi:hypothetical protein
METTLVPASCNFKALNKRDLWAKLGFFIRRGPRKVIIIPAILYDISLATHAGFIKGVLLQYSIHIASNVGGKRGLLQCKVPWLLSPRRSWCH